MRKLICQLVVRIDALVPYFPSSVRTLFFMLAIVSFVTEKDNDDVRVCESERDRERFFLLSFVLLFDDPNFKLS